MANIYKGINQGLARWPMSPIHPAAVKVLLEHGHTYLFIYCLCCFHATGAELSSYDRDLMACKA